jgi:glucose/arabinose dehydrogenase
VLSQPVYVVSPPGDAHHLFIVEKSGTIRIMRDGALLPTPFLDLTAEVSTANEQGLLSLAFSPRYATDRHFYVDYTDRAGDTVVVRYTARASQPDRADPTARRVILTVDQPYENHNGGQLEFGPDGKLYVGLGDGGARATRTAAGRSARAPGQDPASRRRGSAQRRHVCLHRATRRFSFDPANGDL